MNTNVIFVNIYIYLRIYLTNINVNLNECCEIYFAHTFISMMTMMSHIYQYTNNKSYYIMHTTIHALYTHTTQFFLDI
jgi:hypothetical protein